MKCRICQCGETDACELVDETGVVFRCRWVEPELCSACVVLATMVAHHMQRNSTVERVAPTAAPSELTVALDMLGILVKLLRKHDPSCALSPARAFELFKTEEHDRGN